MEKYYKKIWKCSVKGLLLSIFLMFMGAFLMYDFIAGKICITRTSTLP